MRTVTARTVLLSIMLLLCIGWAGVASATVGQILYEYWENIGGGVLVSDLTSAADYPDNPSGSVILKSFVGPRDWKDNFGARIIGYLLPPETGTYTFWIATDDYGELWLSTDDTAANAVKIAEVPGWTGAMDYTVYPEQQSDPINLTAGKVYFIMALMKEGGGGDNISVAWETPSISQTEIAGDYLADANPRGVENPTPAHRTTGIPVSGTLLTWDGPSPDWVTGPTYNVYFGTDPNVEMLPQVASGISDPCYTTGALEYDTTYYWRVDVIDPNNGTPVIITGPAWRFSTESQLPIITRQPQDSLVFPGDTASLSVEAESVTELSYAWFIDDPNITEPVGTEQTLVLSDVQTDAKYYCKITNAAGSVNSDTATVTVKRLVAHWPLDSDYNDAVNGFDGSPVGAPSFTTTDLMADGDGAVSLEGTQSYVAVPYDPALNTENFSCAVWCKVTGGAGSWRAPVSNRYDKLSQGLGQNGWILYGGTNNLWQFWTGTGSSIGWPNLQPGAAVEIDNWVFLVISFEKTGKGNNGAVVGTKRFFINGGLAGISTNETYSVNDGTQFQIGAGQNETPANFYFNGLIDDVKMYNYPLSPTQVAQMYIDVMPDAVICLSNPEGDLNGDCKTDLADLQLLGSNWLSCNRVPECL